MRKIRRPDNIVWNYPWECFCFGFSIQRYGWNAKATTICLGILTLR
jgi:hypothetical protein